MFPYFRILFFVLSVIAVYAFFEWGGAEMLEGTVHAPGNVSVQLVGKPAPDLHVNKSQVWSKQDFLLSELRGRPVVVHFWATWCAPCLQELPGLLKRAAELRGQGYGVVTVAVDESWAKLDEFFARHPPLGALRESTVLLLDPGGKIAATFGSTRFPETFLINDRLLIDNKLVGAQPWDDPQILPYLQRLRTAEKPN